jgi:hypothetical protein
MELKNSWLIYVLFTFLLFAFCHSNAQISISKPSVRVVDDKMIISYEIFGSAVEDTINISLNISDSLGNKIEPVTLEGDIGKNIKPGPDKKIIWDLKVDSFYVNMNIYIGLVADIIKPPEVITPEVAESITAIDDETVPKDSLSAEVKREEDVYKDAEPEDNSDYYSVGRIAMLSAFVPGWGLTKLSHNKPYWLMGVAAAGCVATSVYYNRLSYSNYEKYVDTDNPDNMNSYYNDAVNQQKISNYLAISAVAIWIADIGIASLKAAGINRKNRSRNNTVIMDYHYDTDTKSPVLSFIYKF